MNTGRLLLSGLLIATSFISCTSNHGVYYSELRAFKKAEATKEIFDEDAHSGLAKIQRDIFIDKELSFFQRFVRSMFLSFDVVIVTPETMPKLYAYVEDLCKKARIVTPTIFVTREKWLLNAAAQKLLMSSGAIIIGQKLMHDVSDDALEAIVAHEIGHIKHNHVNKLIALNVMAQVICAKLMPKINVHDPITIWICASLISSAIINKQYEKQADEFACQNGKSKGVIEFFEYMLKKEELREEEFVAIHDLLQKNKSALSLFDNTMLRLRYYIAKFGHLYGEINKYIYHNTFLGAHPSPEARIEAAKKYLQEQEA